MQLEDFELLPGQLPLPEQVLFEVFDPDPQDFEQLDQLPQPPQEALKNILNVTVWDISKVLLSTYSWFSENLNISILACFRKNFGQIFDFDENLGIYFTSLG